nr:bifunctional acetaldehyde-CoA/alcohol dehydrogenase [bacterium]
MSNYPIVESIESLEQAIAMVRKAQKQFAGFSQEQVDRIFAAAASAANRARIPLAKLAIEETGMGVLEDKILKNH